MEVWQGRINKAGEHTRMSYPPIQRSGREAEMSDKNERGLRELYDQDPERADWLVFGRITDTNRRGFLKGAGLAAMTAAVGAASIPFARHMPGGLIPAALAEEVGDFEILGKE